MKRIEAPAGTPVPEYFVPQYVIEDWDRVIGDPNACMARLQDVLRACDLSFVGQVLQEECRTKENDGGTFAPYSSMHAILETLFPADEAAGHTNRVREVFRTLHGQPVIYDDVLAYWHMLDTNNIPHGALTWGLEAEWQWDKIAAGGYTGSVEVTDTKDKGKHIAAMQNEDGTFTVPSYYRDGTVRALYHTPQVCLVEDKIKAFASYPVCEQPSGFIVHRTDPPLKSQRGELPSHLQGIVPIVTGLGSLTVRDQRLVLA